MKRRKSHPICIFVEHLHQQEVVGKSRLKKTYTFCFSAFQCIDFYMTIQSVQTLYIQTFWLHTFHTAYVQLIIQFNMVSIAFLQQKRMPNQLVPSMALWWPWSRGFAFLHHRSQPRSIEALPTKMRRLVLREANVDTGFLLTTNLWGKKVEDDGWQMPSGMTGDELKTCSVEDWKLKIWHWRRKRYNSTLPDVFATTVVQLNGHKFNVTHL